MGTKAIVNRMEAGGSNAASALVRLCRSATERSPVPVVAVGGATHIALYVNPAFCRLAGKAQEELLGRPFTEAVPEGIENGCLALLDRVYITGEAETLADQEHTVSSPADAYWSYTAWVVLDEMERPAGVMLQVTDTTSARAERGQSVAMNEALVISGVRQHELTELAEAAMRRAKQAMLETDHRVKNNLQSIAALLDIQTLNDVETVPVTELVQIRMLIKTLAAVHDMLTLDVKHDPMMSIMSAKAGLESLLPMLREIVGEESLLWSVDEVRLPIKHGIALAVLVNELVCNAVKHGGRKVDVGLRASETTVTLEVCDDGAGFPEGFDPRAAANFGLELVESVSRHDLGGETFFENRPGGGACVRVMFPRLV
jgi:PAS domain S-box-containing protein